jgi:fructose-1,6-bisphosphatase/inositol monophosphatase family enzyme
MDTNNPSSLSSFITFAHRLADIAGDIIRPHFGAHGAVEAKSDDSPVTNADRDAERAMRECIETTYPDHAIYGEEFGVQLAATSSETKNASRASEPSASEAARSVGQETNAEHSRFTWVIDPIDGTRAFIAGRKEWGTLIALCENGVPILGILDQPITGERWVGARGVATLYASAPASEPDTRRRGREVTIRTRTCAALAQAEFSTTSVNYFTPTQVARVVKLAQACRATVKDGDCYAYGLLARGQRDIVMDAGLKPYDILALVPIIEGAGGKITGWDGKDVTLENYREVVAVGDSELLRQIDRDAMLR